MNPDQFDPLAPDLEGFKRMAAELLKALPRLGSDNIESGLKMLGIAYLEMRVVERSDRPIAVGVYEFTSRKCLARQTELIVDQMYQ